MAQSARLEVNGKSIDLQLTIGSENEVGMDVSQLRSQTGAITLDYGYANTGATESAITFIDGEAGILRYRGYHTFHGFPSLDKTSPGSTQFT